MTDETTRDPGQHGSGESGVSADSPWTQSEAPGGSPWTPGGAAAQHSPWEQGGGVALSHARAGFWPRFGASLIDGILLGIVFAILVAVAKGAGNAIGTFISLAYFAYMEGGPKGQTLGKQALGIRVVDISAGGPIGYGRAIVRWLGRIVSTIPLLLGYFWMLWDPQKQTWHDKMASCLVVKT